MSSVYHISNMLRAFREDHATSIVRRGAGTKLRSHSLVLVVTPVAAGCAGDDGRAVWQVELSRAGGVERKASVAVSNGRVLSVETDRDGDADEGAD